MFHRPGFAIPLRPLRLCGESKWKGPSCVKRDFPSASFLSGTRVVFNIGGNKFRMLVTAVFCKERILIKRIVTHAEYDRWKL